MGQLFRSVSVAAAILLGAPLVAIGAYDTAVVQPAVPRVKAILAAADPQDRAPPAQVRSLIVAAHAHGQPFAQRAALLALWRLRGPEQPGRLPELLWSHLLPSHLDASERFGLYTTLSYNGAGYGLNSLALQRFGTPLDRLTAPQAAELVAFLWSPSYLSSRPELLRHRRDKLLAAVQHEP